MEALAPVQDDMQGFVRRVARASLDSVLSAVRGGSKDAEPSLTKAEKGKFEGEFASLLRKALEIGIESAIARKKGYQRGKLREAKPRVGVGTYAWDKGIATPAVQAWLDERAAEWAVEKMVGITDALKKAVGDTMAEGIANGESMNELIARLKAVDEEFTDWHAILISQMSTSTAFSEGSKELFKQTGVMFKSWHWDGGKCGHVSDTGIEDVCLYNESLGIVPFDFMYPSQFGEIDGPPAGFSCGCDLFPEESETGNVD
jgi:hypothetical protein